jgi:hypothetical protein
MNRNMSKAEAGRPANPFAGRERTAAELVVRTLRAVMRNGLAVGAIGCALAIAQVSGTVTNGSTGKAAGGVSVSLVALQGGMQPVASTRTDDHGAFHFTQNATPGSTLVEADFQGVPYYQPIAQDAGNLQLQVFDASSDESKLKVDAENFILQPINGQLAVAIEYVVDNSLEPKRTLYRRGGIFRFRIPADAQIQGARAIGTTGMPVARTPAPTSTRGVYRLDYPIRPGSTQFEVVYRVAYPSLKASLTDRPLYKPELVRIYVPPQMTFDSPAFASVGTDQGDNVYEAKTIAAKLSFNVSGDAPIPQQANGQTTDNGTTGDNGAAAASSPTTSTDLAAPITAAIPPENPVQRNIGWLLALLALGAAAGLGLLASRSHPQPEAAGAPADGVAPQIPKSARAAQRQARQPREVSALDLDGDAAGGAAFVAATAAPDDADFAAALARLKDDLFLLEVRRSTGNITDEEYASLRAELDGRMRGLARR